MKRYVWILAIMIVAVVVGAYAFIDHSNARKRSAEEAIAAKERLALQQLSQVISSFGSGVVGVRNDKEGLSQLCSMAEESKDQLTLLDDIPPTLRALENSEKEFFQGIVDYCRQRTQGTSQIRAACYKVLDCASRVDHEHAFQFDGNAGARTLNKIEKVYKRAFAGASARVVLVRETGRGPASPELSSDFVIPDSGLRRLTESDLVGKSAFELNIARNEIYARHGRKFDRVDFRDYFRRKHWYSESQGYSDNLLTPTEKRNAAFIKEYQKRYVLN